jgi:hypothetical protein
MAPLNEWLDKLGEKEGKVVGWFAVSPHNPSKLTAHWFDNGEWVRTCFVRFATWPEKFPDV